MSDPEAVPAGRPARAAVAPWQQLAVAAGAVLVLGAFLPWARLTAFSHTVSISGIDADDGWMFVLLGAVTIGLAFSPWPDAPLKPVAFYVAGGVSLLLAITQWAHVSDAAGNARGMVHVSHGIGLYALLAGSAAAVATGVLLQRAPRSWAS